MNNQKIFDKLKKLEKEMPGLAGKGDYGDEQTKWLASAHTAISEYDKTEGLNFRGLQNLLMSTRDRQHYHTQLMTIFYSAIEKISTQIEVEQKKQVGGVFGPGARYDFYLALKEILSLTKNEIFIIDPYVDASTVNGFLTSLSKDVLKSPRKPEPSRGREFPQTESLHEEIQIQRSADSRHPQGSRDGCQGRRDVQEARHQ